jgi:tetratricopeptide (TPR) repeat protein
MKSEIEDKISGIMDTIKEVWVRGDKDKTRKLLNEYLLFFPQDDQAILLKNVLKELETNLAADSAIPREQPVPEKQFEELLAKAGRYVGILEFDQAIGILEGLIESFPGQTGILREKIGDCRMLQKDFKSAKYNYEQSLRMGHRVDEIRPKINQARKGLEVAG